MNGISRSTSHCSSFRVCHSVCFHQQKSIQYNSQTKGIVRGGPPVDGNCTCARDHMNVSGNYIDEAWYTNIKLGTELSDDIK